MLQTIKPFGSRISNRSQSSAPKSECRLSTVSGVGSQIKEKPRKVFLKQRKDGYGFYMKMYWNSPMHIIEKVEEGSVAHDVGLRKGEVIACVNGVDVMHASHDECVQLIRDSGDSVELTVASKQLIAVFYQHGFTATPESEDKWLYMDNPTFSYTNGAFDETAIVVSNETLQHKTAAALGEKLTTETGLVDGVKALLLSESDAKFWETSFINPEPEIRQVSDSVHENPISVPARSRKLKLTKGSDGYGFHLIFSSARKGHFIENIEPDSPAERSNVQEGDRLIEVNGVSTEGKTHDEVVTLISSSSSQVKLVVVEHEISQKNMEIKSKVREEFDRRPLYSTGSFQECCIIKNSEEEYEFFLMMDEATNFQIITDITPGGPADRCGLRNGDRLIEVNGINVENKKHKEIVKMIRESSMPNKIRFLVAGEKRSLYTPPPPKDTCLIS